MNEVENITDPELITFENSFSIHVDNITRSRDYGRGRRKYTINATNKRRYFSWSPMWQHIKRGCVVTVVPGKGKSGEWVRIPRQTQGSHTTSISLSDLGKSYLDIIAASEFEGNRSLAVNVALEEYGRSKGYHEGIR